jgi:hypothetical protein
MLLITTFVELRVVAEGESVAHRLSLDGRPVPWP